MIDENKAKLEEIKQILFPDPILIEENHYLISHADGELMAALCHDDFDDVCRGTVEEIMHRLIKVREILEKELTSS